MMPSVKRNMNDLGINIIQTNTLAPFGKIIRIGLSKVRIARCISHLKCIFFAVLHISRWYRCMPVSWKHIYAKLQCFSHKLGFSKGSKLLFYPNIYHGDQTLENVQDNYTLKQNISGSSTMNTRIMHKIHTCTLTVCH